MSYIHHDRNNEQMLIPITLIRGGTSRGFYFEGKNVPRPGEGLEEFVFAVRGSPDPLGMDGLGGDTILQSKAAIISPSSRPGADVDYTFIQILPSESATLTYKMNCGNISAGVPVFALMKNMVPGAKDGLNTIRVYSTNSKRMMYMTVDVRNGEARVDGDCHIAGVPGTASKVLVDFRDQGGAFTGHLFPSGHLVDTITMNDGTTIDVTVVDMVNPCVFFNAGDFGIGYTGLELPNPDNTLTGPPGIGDRLAELRAKASRLLGASWKDQTPETITRSTLPFAVSIASPADYTTMVGTDQKAAEIDLVARFYAGIGTFTGMHSAAPGSGSTCLAAAAAIPGTVPNLALGKGSLKSGTGGDLTFGHPSGSFGPLHAEPILDSDPSKVSYQTLNFPRTARIICDGTVYVKEQHRSDHASWAEADDYTAASFFLQSDTILH
jgi:2-methylaconitate cis-trans-isomerase PrpF